MQTAHVGLSAHRVVVATQGNRWRRGITACEMLTCHASDGEPWRAAVAVLALWLAQRNCKRLTVRVVLSERFVRWQLLPYRPELSGAQELQAYAALRFQDVYGKLANQWQVQVTHQAPGKATPACAIDTALVDALRTTCEAAGARLATLTPYFSAAFDHWRATLNRQATWFGLVEPDGITLSLIQGKQWLGLHTQKLVPGRSGWQDALPGLMTQLSLSSDLAGVSPALFVAGDAQAPAPMPQLPLSWLQPRAGGQVAGSGWRLALGV